MIFFCLISFSPVTVEQSVLLIPPLPVCGGNAGAPVVKSRIDWFPKLFGGEVDKSNAIELEDEFPLHINKGILLFFDPRTQKL